MPSSSPNALKKHGFLINFDRFFTRANDDAFEQIHFTEIDEQGDEAFPALECPENWSGLAAEVLAGAVANIAVPAHIKAVEENTVPSWLWRHVGTGKGSSHEVKAQTIFTRVVGSAAYNGWKRDLFADENQARNFYDEVRYALAQRFIALEPKLIARLGLEWAYGIKSVSRDASKVETPSVALSNKTVDALVSGSAPTKWHKLLTPKNTGAPVNVTFTDVTNDWGQAQKNSATSIIDLLAFRHNDGTINIDALRHATKLLTVLLDLHDTPIGIGFVNLAPLLMALAIPYDSDAGRNLAAAISAVITAQAYATSAELAAMQGASPVFTQHRETVLRNLRNHRRAAYGDRTDYEKLSVLPTPIDLKKSPDLALVAAAQHRWDEALELTRQYGLRRTQVTMLNASPTMALFVESGAQGITPLQSLTTLRANDGALHFETAQVVSEALSRLGYDRKNSDALIRHISGSMTLANAPILNHASLEARNFDREAIEVVENYLPKVNNIRLAFTPWILGEDFCRKVLKVPASKLQSVDFNLLDHIGFGLEAINLANTYCYGQGTLKDSKDLKPQHVAVFARGHEVSAEAQIRMAAAVQSFMSGTVDVNLSVDANTTVEANEKLLLGAWRQGLRAVTLNYVEGLTRQATAKKTKGTMSAFLHTQARPALPTRGIKSKASSRMVSLKTSQASRASSKTRSK